MCSRTCFLTLTAILLAATSNAHLTMFVPVPFSNTSIDSGPITAEQYPCKRNLGYTISEMNAMTAGSQQTLSFRPGQSAVHGGGSCQLSITLDKEPTAQSSFKVIHSIVGGCPGHDGTPGTYDYTIPKEVPNGQATLAWTWFAKLSGAPEMYMNCAPITVTGGASDSSGFEKLPDMFVANIATADCKTPQPGDTLFPDPGNSVVTGTGSSPVAPSGAGCGKPKQGAYAGSPAASQSVAYGGTSPSSAAGFPSGPAPTSAAAAPSTSTVMTMITVTTTGSGFAPTAIASSSAISLSKVSDTVATPSGGYSGPPSAGSSTCVTDGAVVCDGATYFGLCNHGNIVWQPVAAGTTCQNGRIVKKRGIHVARRGGWVRPHHLHA